MIDVDLQAVAKELALKKTDTNTIVPGLDVPVATISATLAGLPKRIGPPKAKAGLFKAPLRPLKGTIYWICAIATLTLSICIVYLYGFVRESIDLIAIPLALTIYLGLRGYVCFRPDAGTLVAHDGRAPVIYLRSFRDDDAMVRKSARFSLNVGRFIWDEYTRSGLRRLLFSRGKVRLEQSIEDEMMPIGPFIAIGEPHEGRPDFGATRAYFEGDDQAWRKAILGWMERAAMIVVIPGLTRGLGWEIGQLFDHGHAGKLVLLFPPEKQEQRIERLSALGQMLPDPKWQAATETTEPSSLVALFAAPGGEIVRCMAQDVRENQIDASVLLAQFLILCRRDNSASI